MSAVLSPCGTYRYRLSRNFGMVGVDTCCFIMLNPSTADAEQDDPTIRRCGAFARSWGFGRLEVANKYPLRATDPDALRTHVNPFGPDGRNDDALRLVSKMASMVVVAWGCSGPRDARHDRHTLDVLTENADLHVLRTTASGNPSHPLYLPGSLKPVPWIRKGGQRVAS